MAILVLFVDEQQGCLVTPLVRTRLMCQRLLLQPRQQGIALLRRSPVMALFTRHSILGCGAVDRVYD